jgi:hypothetical protein
MYYLKIECLNECVPAFQHVVFRLEHVDEYFAVDYEADTAAVNVLTKTYQSLEECVCLFPQDVPACLPGVKNASIEL